MPPCLISFGANMGDPLETIQHASERLQERVESQGAANFRLSRFYRTPPVGGPGGQPPFVNAVAAFETAQSPWDIWAVVRELEHEFGRFRNQRWEARRLDLDILLFGQHRIWTPHLKVPHPRMCMRRFMLIPPAEVAGTWLEPVTGRRIAELADRLNGSPGSLTLLSNSASAHVILEAAARSAMAHWRLAGSELDTLNPTRWVELIQVESPLPFLAQQAAGTFTSKLVVLLAEQTKTDGAWEDIHAAAAKTLHLTGDTETRWMDSHPRYLLPSDDEDWATHELIAALDAMDCPVEVIG